jgi:hypothetical protein
MSTASGLPAENLASKLLGTKTSTGEGQAGPVVKVKSHCGTERSKVA